MRIKIMIEDDNGGVPYALVVPIGGPYIGAFEPLKVCDEPMVAFATGEDMAESRAVQTKYEWREKAAKELAEEIARLLIEAMKERDTYNGYPIVQ